MRDTLIGIGAVVLLGVCLAIPSTGAVVRPLAGSQLVTDQGGWRVAATLPAAGTEPTDLAGDERTYATIAAAIAAAVDGDEKIVLTQLPFGCNTPRVRLIGATEGEVVVLRIYSGAREGASDCEFVPRGTLTWTVGTQGSTTATYEMADTCVAQNSGASTTSWAVASPADNTCAEAEIDVQGDNYWCLVPTAIGCDAKVLIKDY